MQNKKILTKPHGIFKKLKYPKERIYPIAFSTFIFYLAWHPLGDFFESLIIGWQIVPEALFRSGWVWFTPFKIYGLAFLASFIPLTIIVLTWFKLKDENKVLAYGVITSVLILAIIPMLLPNISPSWQNDYRAFVEHKMKPLHLWMTFHIVFWVVWMWLPGIIGLFLKEKDMLKLSVVAWLLFLIILFTTANTGKFLWVSFPAR